VISRSLSWREPAPPSKKGDVVVQFDTSKLVDTLNTRRSDMKQADAEIEQERAKARLLEEQDRTDLLKPGMTWSAPNWT